MSKRLLYKLLAVIFCTSWMVTAAAQKSRYKASLPKVEADNFYKIILPPKVVAKCLPKLADIRIKDENGGQVPYVIKTDLPVFNESSFIEFPIIINRKEADKQTHVVIQNAGAKSISDLLIVVKNTEATRTVTLSGSDDQHQWFVIKENIYLDSYFSNNGSFIQILSFPPSNYKFFQVTIIGQNVLPVNIIKAGIYNSNVTLGKYIELSKPVIKQVDSSDKHSYIRLSFDDIYQVDQLELSVTGPKYFTRSAELYAANTRTKYPFWYAVNSGSPAVLPVQFRCNEIIAEINNEDNPPLKVTGAKAFQLNRYLLAYLEKGKNYMCYFGDSIANAPKYDLEFFKDSIGKSTSEITVGKIESIAEISPAKQPRSIFSMAVLWTVIAAVLALLLIFTMRMTKEVNKRS